MKGGYILRGREDQSHSNNKFRRDTHTPLERADCHVCKTYLFDI